MKKGAKITLAIVGVLLAIVIALGVAVGVFQIIANQNKAQYAASDEFTASWMSYIKDETPLRSVVIPGSHDAGTYTMPFFTRTQDMNAKDQLAGGIRYMDLRVRKKGDKLVTFHGPSNGVDVAGILGDVKKFLTDHPSETVILDCQHFDKEPYEQLKSLILENFKEGMLVRNTSDKSDVEFIDAITLGEARGKALVLWGTDDEQYIKEDYIFKRNDDGGNRANSCLYSPYETKLNNMSSEKYIKEALPHYIEKFTSAGNKGLFVLQGQLTDGLFIRGPRYREKTHRDNMTKYTRELSESENLDIINIIMRDFVNCAQICETLRLNIFKGNVKADSESAYRTGLNNYINVGQTA